MRRLLLAGAAVVGLLLGGCTDTGDDDGAVDEPTGDAPAAFDAELARWLQVCERASSDPEGCGDLVEQAIEAALEGGCRVGAVEALLEMVVAEGAPVEVRPELFDPCPAPLASLALVDLGPDRREVPAPAPEVGLLDTTAVARLFVDTDELGSYLDEVGHLVSYGRRWDGPPGESITVRLDRFADVAGAAHFAAPDPDDDAATIVGVDDGRLTAAAFEDDDGRERRRQVAIGRVCNVVVSLVVRTDDEPWDDHDVETLLVTQVHRVRAATVC